MFKSPITLKSKNVEIVLFLLSHANLFLMLSLEIRGGHFSWEILGTNYKLNFFSISENKQLQKQASTGKLAERWQWHAC